MADSLNWGDFHRVQPISDYWGHERGRPIDRFYIESFLSDFSHEISGNVLEMENSNYTRLFGGTQVTNSEVLDIDKDNPKATIIADLSAEEGIPENKFDYFIMVQTLQFIYDVAGAVANANRLLRPGGILLATVPEFHPLPVRDDASKTVCWFFTVNSVTRMFGNVFGDSNIMVRSCGNVLSATSFLWGLSKEDLTTEELEHNDPDYQMIITIRAQKPDGEV